MTDVVAELNRIKLERDRSLMLIAAGMTIEAAEKWDESKVERGKDGRFASKSGSSSSGSSSGSSSLAEKATSRVEQSANERLEKEKAILDKAKNAAVKTLTGDALKTRIGNAAKVMQGNIDTIRKELNPKPLKQLAKESMDKGMAAMDAALKKAYSKLPEDMRSQMETTSKRVGDMGKRAVSAAINEGKDLAAEFDKVRDSIADEVKVARKYPNLVAATGLMALETASVVGDILLQSAKQRYVEGKEPNFYTFSKESREATYKAVVDFYAVEAAHSSALAAEQLKRLDKEVMEAFHAGENAAKTALTSILKNDVSQEAMLKNQDATREAIRKGQKAVKTAGDASKSIGSAFAEGGVAGVGIHRAKNYDSNVISKLAESNSKK